jgi:hypothetical protein
VLRVPAYEIAALLVLSHEARCLGTPSGGYADELYNILFRLNAKKMFDEGFAYGDAGVRSQKRNAQVTTTGA